MSPATPFPVKRKIRAKYNFDLMLDTRLAAIKELPLCSWRPVTEFPWGQNVWVRTVTGMIRWAITYNVSLRNGKIRCNSRDKTSQSDLVAVAWLPLFEENEGFSHIKP